MYSDMKQAAVQGFASGAVAATQAVSAQKTAVPRDLSSLDRAFHVLYMHVSNAEGNLCNLRDKLAPVLCAANNATGESGPTPGPNCELEERILQLAHRVSIIGDGIGVLSNQVCL